jgi:hypothetical protein
MVIYHHVADADIAASTVEGRVEEPWMSAERVWDRGDHGDACCASYAADVGRKDVAEEIDLPDGEDGTCRVEV